MPFGDWFIDMFNINDLKGVGMNSNMYSFRYLNCLFSYFPTELEGSGHGFVPKIAVLWGMFGEYFRFIVVLQMQISVFP